MMDAERVQCPHNPLRGGIALRAEDVVAVIEGHLDEGLVEDLLFGFGWVRWDGGEGLQNLWRRWSRPVRERVVPRAWALLKLLFLSGPLPGSNGESVEVRPEPAVVPLLRAGRVQDACRIAYRRLFSAGLAPADLRADRPTEDGLRIAAALLVPVRVEDKLTRGVLQVKEARR